MNQARSTESPAYTLPSVEHPIQPAQIAYGGAKNYEESSLRFKDLLNLVRRRFRLVVGVVAATFTLNLIWTFTRTPIYATGFQILVQPIQTDPQLQQLAGGRSADAEAINYNTLAQVLASPQILTPVIDALQKDYPTLNYGSMVGNIRINQVERTDILNISYLDTDPRKAQLVAERIAEAYLKFGSNLRRSNVQQGIDFVEEELPRLQQRVNQLQQNLEGFRQRYTLIDPASRGDQLSSQLDDIEQQQQQTEIELAEAKTSYAILQRQLGYSPDAARIDSALSESSRYQELLNKLQEIETQIAESSTRYQPDTPQMQLLQDKRQSLLPLLQQEAQRILGQTTVTGRKGNLTGVNVELNQQLVLVANKVQLLQSRIEALTTAEQQLKRDFALVPSLSRRYTDLQRQLQVVTESLNRFLAARETLQIEAAKEAQPWRLLSTPELPQSPIFPNVPRNLGLGVIASLLMGAAAAFIAEKLDDVFHSVDELKQQVRLPLLGVIPHLPNLVSVPPELFVAPQGKDSDLENTEMTTVRPNFKEKHQVFRFLEAFRTLHTSLKLLNADIPVRSLVISSSLPSDGKSTVALHLALAAAAMGQRVLLVDADLRRPQIHLQTNLPNLHGLSNIITTNLGIRNTLQRSPLDKNLYVITAGQVPPDPTRLLASTKMQHLMKQLESVFDLVIYDTPPVLGFADSLLVANNASGTIIVVNLCKTERDALSETLNHLQITDTSVLGLVANCAKQTVLGSYYNNGQYYKHYYNTPT